MVAILNLPSGFAQTTLFFSGAALPRGAATTLAVRLDGTNTDAAAVAGVMAGRWAADVFMSGGYFSSEITLSSLLCKFGPLETGPSAEVAIGTAAGSGSAADTPNVSPMVTRTTALGGRRGRGRMYLPPLQETTPLPGGTILGTVLTTLQGYMTDLFDSLVAADLPPVLLHRHDPALGQSPVAPTLVTSFQVSALVATQRRRLRR